MTNGVLIWHATDNLLSKKWGVFICGPLSVNDIEAVGVLVAIAICHTMQLNVTIIT